MKTDLQLKAAITAELESDPAIDPSHIGVAVDNGVVTLSGTLPTPADKETAEAAVRRVQGVRGIARCLEVRSVPGNRRTDTWLVQTALHALSGHAALPLDTLRVEAEDGRLALVGRVDWRYQSLAAQECVQAVPGVRSVENRIEVKASVTPDEIMASITDALVRHAKRQAHHIGVDVDGGVVTLTGVVASRSEHDAAIGTALAARGVVHVVDELRVRD